MTHRAIYETGSPPKKASLSLPKGLSVRKVSTHSGLVADVNGYSFTDDVYLVEISADGPGLYKSEITLHDDENPKLALCSAVWDRVPFLSSTPARVALGARAVRVFLRCPDDSIELTKIVSVPVGTKAQVSSPREILVSVMDGHAGMISGLIEVATTAEGRPPLRIPVVRYSSPENARGASEPTTRKSK